MPKSLQKESLPHSFAWWMVLILFAASVLNYTDRVSISVLSPQIRKEFNLSNSDYAFAVSTFLLVYTVSHPLSGWLIDKIGAKLGFSLSIIVWSTANLFHIFTRGLASLCFFRGLLAIGESFFYPVGIKAISQNFGARDRSKAISLLVLGLSVGVTSAVPLIGYLTVYWGWRWAFVVTSLLGFVLVLPWCIIHSHLKSTKERETASALILNQRDNNPFISVGNNGYLNLNGRNELQYYFRRKELWLLFLTRALGDSVWYFYIFWIPTYLVQNRGFGLLMIARFAWIPFLAADLGGCAAGWVSSRLIQEGWSVDRSRKIILASAALMVPAGTLAYLASSIQFSILLLSVASFGIMAYGTIILTIPSDIFPQKHIGFLMGVIGSSGSLAGAGFQFVVGRFVDRGLFLPIFTLAGILHPVAAVILILGIRIIKPLEYSANQN